MKLTALGGWPLDPHRRLPPHALEKSLIGEIDAYTRLRDLVSEPPGLASTSSSWTPRQPRGTHGQRPGRGAILGSQ